MLRMESSSGVSKQKCLLPETWAIRLTYRRTAGTLNFSVIPVRLQGEALQLEIITMGAGRDLFQLQPALVVSCLG